ncbi:MAG: hypothetical protein JST48_13430 [Bacteroidetes bacterium]|nr:hypothetical protein [Bacteroidota bacterium]
MKKFLPLIFFVWSCTGNETKNQKPLQVLNVNDDEWATYEGRWSSDRGVLSLELSLKEGSVGIDSDYKLQESLLSDTRAFGTTSIGKYTTVSGLSDGALGIEIQNLDKRSEITMFRFESTTEPNKTDEMFFITRGNDELIPCDDHFKPLTTNKKFTLHKRSRLFTVEGYFSAYAGAAEFFEMNTRENWIVADLGEIDKIKLRHKELIKQEFEGVYLKALAYSVADSGDRW